MKLLPDDLLRKLEAQDPYSPLGQQHRSATDEELVQAKFFTPDANWTWYAVSASPDPDTGDVQFFGLVDGLEREFGYFWLSELEEVRGRFGLPVERDLYWEPIPLSKLMEALKDGKTR